jgi:hypothetical protein
MEKYEAQLKTINASLLADPGNEKLLLLKHKIEKLLSLKSLSGVMLKKEIHRDDLFKNLDFALQVGEACEVLDANGKYWKAGNIVSMTQERDFYIVNLKNNDATTRISAENVRRPILREKKPSAKLSKKLITKPHAFKKKTTKTDLESRSDWTQFSKKLMKK